MLLPVLFVVFLAEEPAFMSYWHSNSNLEQHPSGVAAEEGEVVTNGKGGKPEEATSSNIC